MAKQKGVDESEFIETLRGEAPEYPYEVETIWTIFAELNRSRTVHISLIPKEAGFGSKAYYMPITHEEVWSWECLYNQKLSVWELKALFRLDNEYIKTLNG